MTSKWDMPPIEKIHEALSCIADGRVIINEGNANVTSSGTPAKKYLIKWEDNIYSSNDNASYYQGYVGYPVIAVLFLQGKLELNETIASYFKGINWNELNNKFKRKYNEVVAFILEGFEKEGINTSEINDYINKIYEDLKNLDILYQRSKLFPPN